MLNFTTLRPEIGWGSEFCSWYEYTGNVSLSQPGWMGFSPGLFPTQVGLYGEWSSIGPMKNIHQSWLLLKNPKDIYLTPTQKKKWLSLIHHYWIITRYKIRSSVTFLIEKRISSRSHPITVKILRTGNLLVELESKKHTENLLKMEKFHHLKCHTYPHAKLDTSKGVVRSKELSQATQEEIEMASKKQGIKEYRWVTIRRNEETIQTYTYILIFEKPSVPKEIRIGYTIERVE